MTARMIAIATIALIEAASSTAANASPTASAVNFSGRWQVAGVAVPSIGVQALGEDDPALMGKWLTVSPRRLAWQQRPATNDSCVGPQFIRLRGTPPAELRPQLRKLGFPRPTSFAIQCRSGSWGPGTSATIFRNAEGALAMPWYDNGLLKLIRR